ncbi:MAG TPA: ABC transporter ATP-binding protein [Candidatus Paceibacterota bacterium]|nr:ABC transporter ATP-binding protein [Candidatus Paceibacterota bacterium]
MDASHILEVNDIRISYGDTKAVDGVSFSVMPGEIFGLLGPNGAGKTSTLSAIEGLLKPQHGSVHVAGFDIFQKPLNARVNMGIQLQSTSFQLDLHVSEIVALYSSLYGLNLSAQDIKSILEEVQLQDHAEKKAGQLSGGQQQRLALVIATLHNPQLLLLDEPTTGLDPQSRRQLWERIERMRDSGRSILLTTHSMEEARAICDRVAIIDHGQLITIGNPLALIEQYKDDPDVIALSRRGEVTLEDVFIALTGRHIRK